MQYFPVGVFKIDLRIPSNSVYKICRRKRTNYGASFVPPKADDGDRAPAPLAGQATPRQDLAGQQRSERPLADPEARRQGFLADPARTAPRIDSLRPAAAA